MYILALATDYDETLAEHGLISDETYAALERLAKTGRKLIMVTGRELDDLAQMFPRLDIFDKVVAENGALLYTPATKTERVLSLAAPHRSQAARWGPRFQRHPFGRQDLLFRITIHL